MRCLSKQGLSSEKREKRQYTANGMRIPISHKDVVEIDDSVTRDCLIIKTLRSSIIVLKTFEDNAELIIMSFKYLHSNSDENRYIRGKEMMYQ